MERRGMSTLQIVTAKGKELWVRAVGEVVMGGNGPERIFGSFQDIDELKRTELALAESQRTHCLHC